MTPPPPPVRVLMVAIGGYGHYYLQTLLDEVSTERACLAGVVDPEARQSRAWPWVAERGVPVHADVESFYAAGHEADLAVVVSPLHYHVPQSCTALAHGSHVLCDKPLGGTVQEARELMEARDRAGRWVMIGYQWSFSAAIQSLKRDILAGRFGRPRRFSTLCAWPRDWSYYCRNGWAGRLKDAATGRWLLDGPANNAMAHFLHNLLYLAGTAVDRSAHAEWVEGELYRAYPIESCDTAACRAMAPGGLELLCYASHVTADAIQPRFHLEFERAVVSFGEDTRTVVARIDGGEEVDYGAPDDTPQFKKLHHAIDAVRISNPVVVCGPEAGSAQTLVVNGLHDSAGVPLPFPDSLIGRDTGRVSVDGLSAILHRCYGQGRLPSELGVPWAVKGSRVDLRNYVRYPSSDPHQGRQR
jgi:predicted dehydrogenase